MGPLLPSEAPARAWGGWLLRATAAPGSPPSLLLAEGLGAGCPLDLGMLFSQLPYGFCSLFALSESSLPVSSWAHFSSLR